MIPQTYQVNKGLACPGWHKIVLPSCGELMAVEIVSPADWVSISLDFPSGYRPFFQKLNRDNNNRTLFYVSVEGQGIYLETQAQIYLSVLRAQDLEFDVYIKVLQTEINDRFRQNSFLCSNCKRRGIR